MKKNLSLVFICFYLYNIQIVNAQNVAINATGAVPNASAILDVQSTTKGILIPGMTTTQMQNIVSPAKGLLVFNTTTSSFWFRGALRWTELSNVENEVWQLNGDDAYLNTFGKVGIGTTMPKVKLQVTGGTDSSLTSGGYMELGDSTSTNVVFDNNEIQARNNKATSPLYLQYDGGNVHIDGELIKKQTGNHDMTPLCYGKVLADGTMKSGTSNVTVTKSTHAGIYYINCDSITSSTILMATKNNLNGYSGSINVAYNGDGEAEVIVQHGDSNGFEDFSFVFYNQ